jgi:hypothetical protein
VILKTPKLEQVREVKVDERESRGDLDEKIVEFTMEVGEVEGGEIGESMEETMEEREGWMTYSQTQFVTVAYGEELF